MYLLSWFFVQCSLNEFCKNCRQEEAKFFLLHTTCSVQYKSRFDFSVTAQKLSKHEVRILTVAINMF